MSQPVHVVCPGCETLNRVLPDHLSDTPTCGRCHAPLLPAAPLDLDETQLLKRMRSSDLPLLVDFWAPWCGPCRTMAPAFLLAARELSPQVVLGKVNTEEQSPLAARMAIQGVPTVILFRNGREIARNTGLMGGGQIVSWTRNQLSQAG